MTTRRPVTFVHLDRLDHLEEPALQSLFEQLNREFFGGRIPPYRIIYGQPPGGPRGCSGHCDPGTRIIYVEPSPPTPEGLRRVLLHEMAHVGSLGHGKRFQAKLLRLARAGEAWAEKEAAGYAEAIPGWRPLTAVIAEQIRDLAIEHPDRRWSELETLFAIELGRSVAELRRAAPWAERVWDREVSEIKRDRATQERRMRRPEK